MASFTAKDVAALREKTSCGMMDCKKALTQADGDMDKAIEILREQGLAKAVKKADRIAADGIVCAKVCDKCGVGVVVEVNSETDFVAKNADFMRACGLGLLTASYLLERFRARLCTKCARHFLAANRPSCVNLSTSCPR